MTHFWLDDATNIPLGGFGELHHQVKMFDANNVTLLEGEINAYLDSLDTPDPAAPGIIIQDIKYVIADSGGMRYTAMIWYTESTN